VKKFPPFTTFSHFVENFNLRLNFPHGKIFPNQAFDRLFKGIDVTGTLLTFLWEKSGIMKKTGKYPWKWIAKWDLKRSYNFKGGNCGRKGGLFSKHYPVTLFCRLGVTIAH